MKHGSPKVLSGLGLGKYSERQKFLANLRDEISDDLDKIGIQHLSISRVKRFYSIAEKASRISNPFHDIGGGKFFVNTIDDCYRVKNVIEELIRRKNHSQPPNQRFEFIVNDYIGKGRDTVKPEKGKYRALHILIFIPGDYKKAVEIQILVGYT